MSRGRQYAAWVLVAYLVALAFVLLSPSSDVPSAVVAHLERLGAQLGAPGMLLVPGRVEFLANVGLLVPLSLLGSLVWPSWTWRDWTAAGFVLAGSVELAQGLLLEARSATFADIVANALGAAIGGLLVGAATLARRGPR